ncbi:MAG: MATE family efflux transporter [Akkermansia sp.]|nr:MATE family efflux transporter [Akkermansia sp.]
MNVLRKLVDKGELKRLLVLMLPLYIANLMNMGMGVVDTIVAGQAGPEQLAGVALGSSVTVPIMVAVGAVLTIIGPMISRLRGAGSEGKVGLLLNNAKLLALLLMVLEVAALFAGVTVFPLVSDDAVMVQVATDYLYFLMLCVPASVMLRCLQGHFEGYGHTRPAMIIAFIGLLLNIPLNYAFVFGWGPVPAMGGAGTGLTTTLIHYLMMVALLVLMGVYPRYRRNIVQMWANRRAEWRVVRDIFYKGLPLGVASLCEMTFFCVVTLVIAPLGALAVGAHQVAINVSAVLFMFPLSLSIATAIRSAYHVGARDKERFDALLRTSITFMLVVILSLAALTIVFRREIISLYTDELPIVELASGLLFLCAVYQLSDALQALMSGLLRGCHETQAITWVNMFSYWVIGFPLACILIRTDWIVPAMGPAGAWVSFVVALTITALLLSWRFACARKRVFATHQ